MDAPAARRPPTRHRRRGPLVLALLLLVVGGGAAAALLVRLGLGVGDFVDAWQERSTGEVLRYAERRLEGHPMLERIAAPVIDAVRRRVERPVPADAPAAAAAAKGWRAQGVGRVAFDAAGRPLPAGPAPGPAPVPTRVLDSLPALAEALRTARPGDVFEVAPGVYRVEQALPVRAAGTAAAPVTLRAAVPGSVRFEVASVEGLWVLAPYWIVENLDWQGVCAADADCEHAIHVVGAARGTVIVNNRMRDFNAHVKVNGADGRFPDDGLLQWSTLENRATRQTDTPVTPFDLVAASRWAVLDNRVEHFVRAQRATYGIFMKGAGEAGRIARNLVLCTRAEMSQPGLRVGISVGGGGTGATACREGHCAFEHRGAEVVNNVVAHCNDVGIDVNRSIEVRIAHNTLVNTGGLGVRGIPASALARNNLLDGPVRARDGGGLDARSNLAADLRGLLRDPDRLDLTWLSLPDLVDAPPDLADDFCGRPRPRATPPGATATLACDAPR
jgi:hypothetical protein